MAIVMDMSSYEVERVEEIVETYSDEVMYAEWNPQLQLAEAALIAPERRSSIPHSLVDEDIEGFLDKMYASQR